MKRLLTPAISFLNFWRVIWRYAPTLRKELPLVGIVALVLFAELALVLLEPWPLKLVFDQFLNLGSTGNSLSLPLIGSLDPLILLIFAAVALVTIVGLRTLAVRQSAVRLALLGSGLLVGVEGELYCQVERFSGSRHDKTNLGHSVERVIGDVAILKAAAATAARPLLQDGLIVIGLVTLLFWVNREMALLSLLIAPLFWLLTIFLWSHHRQAGRGEEAQANASAVPATEVGDPMRLKENPSSAHSDDRAFSRLYEKFGKNADQAEPRDSLLGRPIDLLIALSTGLVLLYGGSLVLHGTLTPGDLVVFLVYLNGTFKRLPALAEHAGALPKALAASERVLQLLASRQAVRDLPNAIPAHSLQGMVAVEAVSFDYEPGCPILRGIDFQAYPGNLVAIVGPSASGKSTLVNLILRFHDPVLGRVCIDGRDIRDYALASLRARIGVVRQDNLIFAASVEDNIAYGANFGRPGNEDQIERRLACLAAATLANAHDFIVALPQGYETILGEGGPNLSHSQRLRIGIARAAMRKSSLLILDEPTTGLDEKDLPVIVEALARLARGRTTLLITQDLRLAASASLILYMEGGRIVERGRHHDLLRAGGRYAAMFGIPAVVNRADTQARRPALVR